MALPGPSYHSTDETSDQGHLSPLSQLQEEWLDVQSLFVSDDENEGTNTAEDEARYSSADEREHIVPRRRRAYVSKGIGGEGELSLQEMTTFIQHTGIPDALVGWGANDGNDSQPWEEALSSGTARPRLNISKSHKPDVEVTMRFDVDAVIAEISSLEAFEQHALWIDEVVLPSLRSLLPPTSMQHFPATWAIGASKMRAKHNEHRTWDTGGTNAIHYPVKEAFVPGL